MAEPTSRSGLAVLEVRDLKKHFPVREGPAAPHRRPGATRSTASASRSARARRWASSASRGCGKSTVGRTVLRLIEPTAGAIRLDGPATSRIWQDRAAALSAGRCRSSSRTRSPRSTRACRPATSSASRCACTASPTRRERATSRSPRCSTGSGCGHAQMDSYPARVLRRPAPAHRHRPRAGAAAQADRRRRAGVGARRVDPGAGHQPAAGSAARAAGSPICSSRTISRWSSTSATASR